MKVRAPNLLVPGTQKAGTTFLCAHLARHPAIYFSEPKELHFFSRKELGECDFLGYIDRHFAPREIAGRGEALRYIGEGSTTYFQRKLALERIVRYLGREIRAIVCIRHPLEKAISYYLHNWRRGRLTGSEPITSVHRGGFSVYRSTYLARHAQNWIRTLGREQLLFLRYEALREDPVAFMRQATDFLGLDPLPRVSGRRMNAGFELLWDGTAFVPDVGPSDIAPGKAIPRFEPRELRALQAEFERDVEKTGRILDQDLSAWLAMPRLAERQPG